MRVLLFTLGLMVGYCLVEPLTKLLVASMLAVMVALEQLLSNLEEVLEVIHATF